MILSQALGQYLERVSVHKKGFAQERYRIAPILSHEISKLYMDEITSVDIASYRDDRLAIYSVKTKRPLSPNTVRLELAVPSEVDDVVQFTPAIGHNNVVLIDPL